MLLFYFFFFFQAEDGIRDLTVTGVQTCALPISRGGARSGVAAGDLRAHLRPAGRLFAAHGRRSVAEIPAGRGAHRRLRPGAGGRGAALPAGGGRARPVPSAPPPGGGASRRPGAAPASPPARPEL